MNDFEIFHLPKDKWKDYLLPLDYTTTEYYDVTIDCKEGDYNVAFHKIAFETPVTHTSAEYDYPDKLYADHWKDAYAWGVITGGKLIAAIETCPDEWCNRLRITELWVAETHRRQGIGRSLMNVAKEQARLERRRTVILETQSCNTNAIAFYLSEGFTLIGFDSCCYTSNDLKRKEVRMELGWFPSKKEKLPPKDVIIREERPDDWFATELITKKAFWNKHHQGCDEHYLVHKLRSDPSYMPNLSRVAEVNGKIVGCIIYTKAYVSDGTNKTELLTFGPLCVDPEYQGRGIGRQLLTETMKLAADSGCKGIIIYGEPDYYPLLGFKTCDNFGITTPDGKNFSAFMGIELIPDGMSGVHGKFYEADVFKNLPSEEVVEYDKHFPYIPKQKFPCQWD